MVLFGVASLLWMALALGSPDGLVRAVIAQGAYYTTFVGAILTVFPRTKAQWQLLAAAGIAAALLSAWCNS